MRPPSKHSFLWPTALVLLLVLLAPLLLGLMVNLPGGGPAAAAPSGMVAERAELMAEQGFWLACASTAITVLASVTLQFGLGLALALALHAKLPGRRLIRLMIAVPLLTAPIVGALLWRLLAAPADALAPAADPAGSGALATMLAELWQWTPLVALVLLAGRERLPAALYEMAVLEEASLWQQFRTITWPLLLPLSIAIIGLRLVEGFRLPDALYRLSSGAPLLAADQHALYAYDQALRQLALAGSSAVSVLLLLLVALLGTAYLGLGRPRLAQAAV